MFDWLFEGRLTVYLALAVVGLILLGMWVRDRRRRGWLFALGGVGVLVLTYFLLDRLVETDREQISRKLHEMAGAVHARNTNRIMEHISDRFRFAGLDKAGFRSYVERVLRNGRVRELTVWNLDVPDSSGQVSFMAKPTGTLPGTESGVGYRVRARFVKESGQWRVEWFEVFNPFVNTQTPLDIPQLPQ